MSFRDLPIATKLNLIQSLAVFLLFCIAITGMTLWLSNVLEAKSMANIKQANHQALDMVEAYSSTLEKSAEKLANVLVDAFPHGFTLDEGGSVEIAGKSTPVLRSGGTTLNLNFEAVDHFTATTGVVATIFARQGEDFVRVSTSVKKENGERAVGTSLGAAHPAHDLLLKGESYTGKARLFGRDYMTRYIPQRDKSGRIVAVLFVGLDFTSELVALKEKIKSIKFLKTGYIYAVDAGKDKGTLVIHPASEGKNLLEAKDANGVAYIADMVDKKNGEIRYQFMNPALGETSPRDKIAVFSSFPKWNWVIASSAYSDELAEEVAQVRNVLIFAGLTLPLFLVAVVYFSSRQWVTKPLNETVHALQKIADGDLVVDLPPHGKDEVGRLLTATKQMAGSMRDAITNIKTAAVQLVDSAHHLSSSSTQVATQSGLQSDAAADMAASIEEMNSSIAMVSDHALQAREVSVKSGHVSSDGAAVIQQAVGSMTEIAGTVRQASEAVTQLGQESQAISDIVHTIQEIADQTNLLALNAAIEAARAGEQGRGFAVVADEVRKLAERTSVSTKEIEGMIGKILQGTNTAVASMETGVKQVEEGVGYAERAGGSIADIQNSALEVAEVVTNISQALAEQTVASGTIANNVERIAGVAEQNSQVARESAKHAKTLEQLAESLTQRVSHFQV
jgi:methyl-accepting chemotaxis protein